LERAGIERRMDARSWADQGREDLAELREPKLLGGEGREAIELREQVAGLRQKRAELPAQHLDQAAAVEQVEREAQKAIAAVEKRRDEELSIVQKWIDEARELYVAAKAALERKADQLLKLMSGADAFDRTVDVDLARKNEAVASEQATRKARVPDREDLDRQLRQIARSKGRYPEGKIEPAEELSREITGRVIGYTDGKEEALFQRLTGGLVRLDMRDRKLLPVNTQIDYDPRSRGISRERGGHSL
jgi:hypothetical protein